MLTGRACHVFHRLMLVSPLQSNQSRATSSDTTTSTDTSTSVAASRCIEEAPYLLLMHDDPTVNGQLRSVFLLL
jgi:hypothetical protein